MMAVVPSYIQKNSSYIPLPVEEGCEYYSGGVIQINISLLIQYIEENPSKFNLIDVDIKDCHFSDVVIDHFSFIPSSKPCIYAELSPNNYSLIDGRHRYSLAKEKGDKYINCYQVPVHILINFFVSHDMYLKFVDYWNGKVNDYFEDQELINRS